MTESPLEQCLVEPLPRSHTVKLPEYHPNLWGQLPGENPTKLWGCDPWWPWAQPNPTVGPGNSTWSESIPGALRFNVVFPVGFWTYLGPVTPFLTCFSLLDRECLFCLSHHCILEVHNWFWFPRIRAREILPQNESCHETRSYPV